MDDNTTTTPMPHRSRFQYNIRNQNGKLILSIFTDVRICKLPFFGNTQVNAVAGDIVLRIARSEAAHTLRRLRHDGKHTVTRIVDTYNSSDFCTKYCMK